MQGLGLFYDLVQIVNTAYMIYRTNPGCHFAFIDGYKLYIVSSLVPNLSEEECFGAVFSVLLSLYNRSQT